MSLFLIKEIAIRMKDPSHVREQVLFFFQQSNSTGKSSLELPPWSSLSHGYQSASS